MHSKETKEMVAGLRLIDDTLFRVVAARKDVCQEILRTLLDKPELVGLFLKKEAFNNPKFPLLSDAINYYKNTKKGSGEMCDIVEEYARGKAQIAVQNTLQNIAVSLFSENWTDEKIRKKTGLPIEEVAKLRTNEG